MSAATAVPYNLGAALYGKSPDATALIDLSAADRARTYSYRQLDDWCDAAARGLLARGLRAGDRVAIVSANRAEYLTAFLGAMRAGLVPVPVNVKLLPIGIQYVLEDSGAKLALADSGRMDSCASVIPAVSFDGEDKDSFTHLLSHGPFDSVRPHSRQPAMFLYTSGSTGTPKGVVLSHESHLWVVEKRRRLNPLPAQRVLVAAPLYHMNALSTSQAALAQGDSVVLLPSFQVDTYIDAIARYRCTALTGVPTMIAMMLRSPELRHVDLSPVRSIRMGSAPVSSGLAEEIREQFPHAQVANVYGTTEAGPITFAGHPSGLTTPAGSLGYAHPEVHMRLDAAAGTPSEGVLQMKSPALMNGYHKLPDLMAACLTSDGYYITGDVFHRDENGFYFFVGRADDMFACGGENIYPRAVETTLEAHPAVEQAAVVPVADEIKWQKPVAFVVIKPGSSVSEMELKTYALGRAPAYQHPRRIWFLKELPLAGTNKIDKAALMARAAVGMATEKSATQIEEKA